MASSKIPLFLSVTLMLTHMTAGFPRPIDMLDPNEEERVFPPLTSTNETLRTRSLDVKRFIDSNRACQEVYSRLNPQKYFNTRDIFIPRFVYNVRCEGTASNPPTCGVTTGRMRCMTRMGNVEVMRIPRGIGQCFRRSRETIYNVPVGCYCV